MPSPLKLSAEGDEAIDWPAFVFPATSGMDQDDVPRVDSQSRPLLLCTGRLMGGGHESRRKFLEARHRARAK
jgi:hypothetical protein